MKPPKCLLCKETAFSIIAIGKKKVGLCAKCAEKTLCGAMLQIITRVKKKNLNK